ncbi:MULTISPECIES: hypothetical protein [Paracoccaceae]|uniref:hypothetical protein n=1 Tax=Paracoccaceae TaxID=31989 RepID=UPI0018E7170F|nr:MULTISPECIES: hypothetical protein [Paracoccaceae]MBJ2149545.1 hypothetical protein [Paracoccus sp. IB05]
MAKTATACDFAIPVDSINSLRASFPGISLIFEIDLAVEDCWDGLEHLAGEFRRAGARLRLLRATQSGVISCTVVDGGSDLSQLAQSFASARGVSVSGWTTRIQYD